MNALTNGPDLKFGRQRILIKVDLNERQVRRNGQAALVILSDLRFLGYGGIQLEYFRRPTNFPEAQGARVESRAEDKDLVEPPGQGFLEDCIDILRAGDDIFIHPFCWNKSINVFPDQGIAKYQFDAGR